MPKSPEPAHGQPDVLASFVSECLSFEALEEVKQTAIHFGAKTALFSNSVSDPTDPTRSLDLILPDGQRGRRLLIHETFPPDQQEEGETILRSANVDFFPEIGRTALFSFREMPLVTMPLLSHSLTKPAAETIGVSFLSPVLKKLFEAERVVPSRHMLAGLVHVEDLRTIDGSDQIDTGVRFIPPYVFESVDPENFVIKAVKNAADYGPLVVRHLRQALDQAS